jgi:hypothetical protein
MLVLQSPFEVAFEVALAVGFEVALILLLPLALLLPLPLLLTLPFDQAILAAILVRAEELIAKGVNQMDFCELDSHLHPWDKDSRPKKRLTELYDQAHIRVHGDFLLQVPEKPAESS